jgi:hypothetical protein
MKNGRIAALTALEFGLKGWLWPFIQFKAPPWAKSLRVRYIARIKNCLQRMHIE